MIDASAPMAAPHALVFVAWSRIFSPLVDDALRREAWQQLELPGDFDETAPDFMRAFHVSLPQPPAPLLMHAALHQDGGSVREDFVRVMDYLDVDYEEGGRLPPDHLACACELVALSIDAGEPVLVDGLRVRYLGPWVAMAREAVGGHPVLAGVVEVFAQDLAAL